jgi:TRAP-type C4-dicarboxylate transport system permease small subunit
VEVHSNSELNGENIFVKSLHRIIYALTAAGSVFLGGMMLWTVAGVIVRPFGEVIAGVYEVDELLMVTVVASAICYTAMKREHITVDIIISRISPSGKVFIELIVSTLSLVIWSILFWATTEITLMKWLEERTFLLRLYYLPFRFIWLFGLIIICLVFLRDIVRAVKQVVKK